MRGAFGFLLAGPWERFAGWALGHHLDQKGSDSGLSSAGMDIGSQQRVRAVLFIATLSVMGYVAKADGWVR